MSEPAAANVAHSREAKPTRRRWRRWLLALTLLTGVGWVLVHLTSDSRTVWRFRSAVRAGRFLKTSGVLFLTTGIPTVRGDGRLLGRRPRPQDPQSVDRPSDPGRGGTLATSRATASHGHLGRSSPRDHNNGHGQEAALYPDLRPGSRRASGRHRAEVSFADPRHHRGAVAVRAGDGNPQPKAAGAAYRPGSGGNSGWGLTTAFASSIEWLPRNGRFAFWPLP